MMKNLRRYSFLFLIVAVAVVALAACEGQTPIAPASSSRSSSSQVEGTNTASSDRADAAVWPTPAPKDQKIELAPNPLAKNYYFMLDGSGSMKDKACGGSGEEKIIIARRALKELMVVIPADANVGFAAFDLRQGTSERVPIGSGLGNRDAVSRAIDETVADGGTPLHNAVVLGYQKLEHQARRQLGYGEYHFVIVTDGEANAGQDPTNAVNFILSHSPVVVHTIGFCIGGNHSLNQKGRIHYKEATDYQSLKGGLEEVIAEAPVFDAKAFQQ